MPASAAGLLDSVNSSHICHAAEVLPHALLVQHIDSKSEVGLTE